MKKLLIMTGAAAAMVVATSAFAEDGYLESEGDAFISLGHCAGPNTKIEVDLQITTNEFAFKEIPFGSWGNNSDSTLFECYISYGNATTMTPQFSWEYSTTSGVRKAYNCDVVDQERHVISFDAATRTYKSGDYTYVFSDPVLDITSTIPMSIFGRCSSKYATTTAHFGGATKMKVYGVKIWESGTLVKNFVPCLSSGIPGLRDLVNNLFVTGIDPSKVKYGGNIMEKDDAHLDLDNVINTSKPGENHYFNLPYTFKPTSRIEVDYALLAQGFTSSPFIFSVDGPSAGPWMQVWTISGHYAFTIAGQQRYYANNGVGAIENMSVDTEYGVRRTVAMNSNSVWFVTAGYTNAVQTSSPALTTSDNYRIIVGNRGNDLGRWMPMRLYGIKVYENNDMVKNYVPIVTNGVPCLIDTVGGVVSYPITQSGNSNTKSLVVNAGGEFDGHTAASEKEAYLEFPGTQSLDLGYSLTPNSCLEADFAMWDTYKNGTSNQELIRQENGSSGTYMRLAAVGANAYTDLWWQYSDGAKSTIESTVKNSNERLQYIFDSYHSKTTFKCGGNVLYDVTMPETRTSTTGSGSLKLGLSSAYMRLYGLKISEEGQPVRNYVPSLTNGVAGLYETHTKTFFPLTGGKVSGKGYRDQENEFETVPQPMRLAKNGSGTLTCFAPSAQSYEWYEDGKLIEGETGDSLTLTWTREKPHVRTYSVKPVYTVFNEKVLGEAASAEVEFIPLGLIISIK